MSANCEKAKTTTWFSDLFIFKVRYIYSVKRDAAFWTDFWKGFKWKVYERVAFSVNGYVKVLDRLWAERPRTLV